MGPLRDQGSSGDGSGSYATPNFPYGTRHCEGSSIPWVWMLCAGQVDAKHDSFLHAQAAESCTRVVELTTHALGLNTRNLQPQQLDVVGCTVRRIWLPGGLEDERGGGKGRMQNNRPRRVDNA